MSEFISLYSGSSGNSSVVRCGERYLIVDMGKGVRTTGAALKELELNISDCDGILVTHEHSDHIKGLEVWCKHWNGPIFSSRGTLTSKESLAHLPVEEFDPGDTLSIAGVHIQTYSTSHDVVNPVGYRFDAQGDSVGFATDTGELSKHAIDTLKGCRILALESNHDVTMLRQGDYPRFLQERILSVKGHLSNDQAADAARALVTDRTEQLIAMHISQDNNRPSLTVKSYASSLGATLDNELGSAATRVEGLHKLTIRPAGQYRPMTIQ